MTRSRLHHEQRKLDLLQHQIKGYEGKQGMEQHLADTLINERRQAGIVEKLRRQECYLLIENK